LNHRFTALYAELERPDLVGAYAQLAAGIYQACDDVPSAWRADLKQIIEAHDLQ